MGPQDEFQSIANTNSTKMLIELRKNSFANAVYLNNLYCII